MSMLKRLFLLTVFVGCVSGGFLLAINLGVSGQAQGLPVIASPVKPGENGVAANGQRNLLLIGVNDMNSTSPQLNSVWMVLQIATHSPQRFTLVPLYPATGAQVLVPQDELQASFRMDANGGVQPEFFEEIKAADFWWSNYLVIDQAGLAELIDLGGGIDLGNGSLKGKQVTQMLTAPELQADTALGAQAAVFQAVCSQSAEKLLSLDAKKIFQKLGRHLRTDLEIERFTQEWQMPLILAGRPSCEFPTLQASQMQIGGQ